MLKVLSFFEDQGENYIKDKVASTYFSNSIGVDCFSFKRNGWSEFKYAFPLHEMNLWNHFKNSSI